MTSPDIHSLIGAYALDAVTEIERRQFDHHLMTCPTCVQELRGLRQTAARLGAAATHAPPSGLRDEVMRRIGQTRQLPPHTSRQRHRPFAPVITRIATRPRLLVAAACIVAVISIGLTTGLFGAFSPGSHGGDQATQQLQREIRTVLAAPDAARATAPVATGGTGTVVTSRSLDRVVITMAGLARLPAGKTYELWLMGDQSPRGAGLVPVANKTVLARGIVGTREIGLTVEPAGGSPAPTTAPILTINLPT